MKVKILNLEQLEKNIAEYEAMFPQNFLSLEDIDNILWEDYSNLGGTKSLFGMSVSEQWPDKCYSFVFVSDDNEVVYEYKGLFKT